MSDQNSANSRMLPPDSGIKVRMYRPHGIGDTFLLAFRGSDGKARYVLIDCGVFMGTDGAPDRMKAIAQSISDAVDGALDVIVATHEHWDHLSGFQFGQSIFDKIKVDNVWMAWTDDPADALAKSLHDKRTQALKALTSAATRLQAANDPMGATIDEVLKFSGGLNAAQDAAGVESQWEYVRHKVATPHYCRPGEPPLAVPGVDGVRVYVLGPPTDATLLGRSNPSTKNSEVYGLSIALTEQAALYAAVKAEGQRTATGGNYPFDAITGMSLQDVEADKEYGRFFREQYGFGAGEKQGPSWRRIGSDWLRAAGALAVQLDSDTNNTSLVLAFELAESGKVLLFPADAQVGNWLSWQKLSWPAHGGAGHVVTANDLLSRTAFYKVGHHGSHNATLRQQGLELMQDPELVAMIPVDQASADQKKWAMPFPSLLQRLEQKAAGGIIRADLGLPNAHVSAGSHSAFAEDSGPDKLWLEYTVLDSAGGK